MGFLMNNEDLQNFSFGSFLVQKICSPKVLHPPAAKMQFLLSPHIFGLKLFRLLKLGVFTDIFPLISDKVFDFLILCLNFKLQTFKNARFFKNILFYTFF